MEDLVQNANDELPSEDAVAAYLRAHPEFLQAHPELVEVLLPPEVDHGGNVVDMRQFMVGKLQKHVRTLKDRFEGLILSSRDNMSTQQQVHAAVLAIVRARGLEELAQVMTMDLASRFDVDVVRIALASDIAGAYQSLYPEQNYSGLAFVETGVIEDALAGEKEGIRLIEDIRKTAVAGVEQIFDDCSGLVRSAALLKLHLPQAGRDALLAFGVRHEGRFHPGQGVELLVFLAKVAEHRLDQCLQDSGIEALP